MRSRHLVAIGVSLASAACLNTEQVDITSGVKVDDFEDSDEVATKRSGFGPWWCISYSTGEGQQANPTCGVASPGFESHFAEFVAFSLHESNSADYPGVVLGVSTLAGTRDLSSYESLRFRAKFEPGEPAPPNGTRLLSELDCASAPVQPNDNPGISIVYHGESLEGVELPRDWSSYTLPLGAFRQNQYQQARLLDETSCVKLVDSIRFRIEPALMIDGQEAAGTLTIDDVYFE